MWCLLNLSGTKTSNSHDFECLLLAACFLRKIFYQEKHTWTESPVTRFLVLISLPRCCVSYLTVNDRFRTHFSCVSKEFIFPFFNLYWWKGQDTTSPWVPRHFVFCISCASTLGTRACCWLSTQIFQASHVVEIKSKHLSASWRARQRETHQRRLVCVRSVQCTPSGFLWFLKTGFYCRRLCFNVTMSCAIPSDRSRFNTLVHCQVPLH